MKTSHSLSSIKTKQVFQLILIFYWYIFWNLPWWCRLVISICPSISVLLKQMISQANLWSCFAPIRQIKFLSMVSPYASNRVIRIVRPTVNQMIAPTSVWLVCKLNETAKIPHLVQSLLCSSNCTTTDTYIINIITGHLWTSQNFSVALLVLTSLAYWPSLTVAKVEILIQESLGRSWESTLLIRSGNGESLAIKGFQLCLEWIHREHALPIFLKSIVLLYLYSLSIY